MLLRAVVQRVSSALVTVDGSVAGEIGKGLVVLVGVGREDAERDIEYLAEKITGLRVFPDQDGKMNLSVREASGSLLIVSQFTLYGDCRKGKRPGYDKAAAPDQAIAQYDRFVDRCKTYGIPVETGVFQADMLVSIQNDGPVTLLIDSKKEF